MTARRLTAALAVAILASALASGADDPYGDPIPEGAKLRLGTARLRSNFGGFGGSFTAMTPDGKFLVAPAPGGGIAFVEPATGKVARTLRVEGVFGSPAAFSADGKRAVVAGYGQPAVFDVEAGKSLAKLARPTPGGDHGVALSGDGKLLAAGGTRSFDAKDKDKGITAVVWDVDGDKEVCSITPAQSETVYVAISADGKRLATWGFHIDRNAKGPPKAENDPSRQIQFWDAATGKELAKVTLAGGYNPSTVALSPDGSVAAASGGSGIYLFETATGKSKGLLLGRSRQGRKLAFSPDGKSVATAGDDGYVQTWSVADGKRTATTRPPVVTLVAPRGIQFVGNDRVVAWGNRGTAAVVWEAPPGKLLSSAGGHTNAIMGLAVAAGGKEFYTGDSSGTILRWDAATGKELGALELEGTAGLGFGRGMVIFSPDGSRALCSEAGGLGVYDLPAGTQQFLIPGDFNLGSRGSFTVDGTRVVQAMSSYDPKTNPGRAVVWDIVAGKKLAEVGVPDVSDLSAALSPDGKMLITAGVRREPKGPGKVVVAGWELASGKKLGEYEEENQGFGLVHVAAAGDNRSAVVVGPREGAIVVDVVAGARTHALEAPGQRAGAAPVVSPDGKTVAIPTPPGFGATPTYSVLLFDIESGKLKKTLEGLSGTPSAAAFSPDGKWLLTGSADTTALVWEVGG